MCLSSRSFLVSCRADRHHCPQRGHRRHREEGYRAAGVRDDRASALSPGDPSQFLRGRTLSSSSLDHFAGEGRCLLSAKVSGPTYRERDGTNEIPGASGKGRQGGGKHRGSPDSTPTAGPTLRGSGGSLKERGQHLVRAWQGRCAGTKRRDSLQGPSMSRVEQGRAAPRVGHGEGRRSPRPRSASQRQPGLPRPAPRAARRLPLLRHPDPVQRAAVGVDEDQLHQPLLTLLLQHHPRPQPSGRQPQACRFEIRLGVGEWQRSGFRVLRSPPCLGSASLSEPASQRLHGRLGPGQDSVPLAGGGPTLSLLEFPALL